MTREAHWRGLEALLLASPTNERYRPRMTVTRGRSEVEVELRADMLHAAGAVHGGHLFKLLDDAAFFAASSHVEDRFLATVSFTVHLMRPIGPGLARAIGTSLRVGRRLLFAEAQLLDGTEGLVAHGVGTFTRSAVELASMESYRATLARHAGA